MKSADKPIAVLVADDHSLVVEGLQALMEQMPGIELVSWAANGRELLEKVPLLMPNVILLDIDMPVMNGLQALEVLSNVHPSLRVIMLSMHLEPAVVNGVLKGGASGFLHKNTSAAELELAIRTVHKGGEYVSSQVARSLLNVSALATTQDLNDVAKLAQLTSREREIAALIAQGYSNKEIGDQLHISHRTVDTHRTSLMEKLAARNVVDVVRFAIRVGLVEG